MRLYEYLQTYMQTTNIYQALITMAQAPNALLNGNYDTMPIYAPTDPEGLIRKGLLQKIMARYYNYSLFTADPNYFSQRVYWRLVEIMPTYAAKFSATVTSAEFEDAYVNGVVEEYQRTRNTKGFTGTTSSSKSASKSASENSNESTDQTYNSDYPQIAGAVGDYNTTASKSKGTGSGSSTGESNATSEGAGTSNSENSETYSDKRTRHLSPDEILLAKQKILNLIINIDEEIVNDMCNLFKNLWGCDCDQSNDEITKKQLQLQQELQSYEQQIAELSIPKLADLEVTENGTVTVEEPYIGFKTVTVNVEGAPVAIQDEKLVDVTVNGTTEVTPANGYAGMAKVTINTNVAQTTEVKLANGTYKGVDAPTLAGLQEISKVYLDMQFTIGDTTYTQIGVVAIDGEVDTIDYQHGGQYVSAYTDGAWVEGMQEITLVNESTVELSLYNWFIANYNVVSGGANLQAKNVTYISNGARTIEADDGFDGLSTVTVNVNVTQGEAYATVGLYYADEELSVSWLEYGSNTFSGNFFILTEPDTLYKRMLVQKDSANGLTVTYIDVDGVSTTVYTNGAWVDNKFRAIRAQTSLHGSSQTYNWFRMSYTDITSRITEIDTESRMNTLLTTGYVGAIYKYTGTDTAEYTNGELYIIQETDGEEIYFIVTYATAEGALNEMECYAKAGDTWEGAITTDMNLGTKDFAFTISGNTVMFTDNDTDRQYQLSVSPTDTITANESYESKYVTGG